jgi:phosphoribosylamine--glycine ligase
MNVLIIGSGGREHALGLKIKESKSVDNLYFMPGNGGTVQIGHNAEYKLSDLESIYKFCKYNAIDLVVIGPEQPLVDGLSDYLREKGINVFGPTKKAAVIEGEKSFAKQMMLENEIPTATFKVFKADEKEIALSFVKTTTYPLVIKADGLAAGKGVIICENLETAMVTIDDFFERGKFGDAGSKIVIEEFLSGEEVSVFAVTDGNEFLLLPPSQDHKKIFNGDKGPNTGGMGAYAPVSFLSQEIYDKIQNSIVIPTLSAMKRLGREFSGLLYFGLIITENGPKVIEYNCRFGDPETQAVLPLLEGDFAQLLFSVASGKLDKSLISVKRDKFAVSVVAASKGYPGKYEKGKIITGLDEITDSEIFVFHAGTKKVDNQIYTNGGRVLAVTSVGNTIDEARKKAYENLSKINFEGIYFRTDIAEI